MRLKSVLVLLSITVIALSAGQQQKKERKTICPKIRHPKCIPGKGGCLGRVFGVSFKFRHVTSKGFIVSWKPRKAAVCYYLELLKGYTTEVVQIIPCYVGTSFKFTGLSPWTRYGIRVSFVNRWCSKGPPNQPTLTIKTRWDKTFFLQSSTTMPATATPKPEKCGQKRFTCHESKYKQKWRNECIPNAKWCNLVMDCEDGSDEKNCPDSCSEIKVEFKNGNYSCTRFNSPGSFCDVDCDEGYERDGPSYFYCVKSKVGLPSKWSSTLPICRVAKTASFEILPDEIKNDSVAVRWNEVDKADHYVIHAVHYGQGESELDFTVSAVVNATECCKGEVSNLKPSTEYEMALYAIDGDGVRGMRSSTLFVVTESNGGPTNPN